MAKTAADVLIETLIDWDVNTIFGLPGDGINGIMESLRTHQEQIRFIQVRHEEAAALMACAYAKYTGKLGVCLATSGPGGIHLLNGLYDAKLDGQPVLAITGLPFHDLNDTFTQQDVALDRLFMDVAAYTTRVMGPSHVENVVELACRTAIAYRKVSHIAFPVDIQDMKADRKHASKRNVPHHTSDVLAHSARLPHEDDLRRAADILNQGKKVAILAGQGALNATDALERRRLLRSGYLRRTGHLLVSNGPEPEGSGRCGVHSGTDPQPFRRWAPGERTGRQQPPGKSEAFAWPLLR